MVVGIGLMAGLLSWIVGVVIVDIKKTIKHNLITFYSTLDKLSNEVSHCSFFVTLKCMAISLIFLPP